MPDLLEVIPLKSGLIGDMPFPDNPYYVVASDGILSRKNTAMGVVTIKEKYFPKHLAKSEIKTGSLKFSMEPLPKAIIERAFGFFRHVFKERDAEAEVLILFNENTKQYQLFAPHQETDLTGVESIYDPADIPDGFIVVGSIHSHCDFGAFHSSTDELDASDFNGIHITMGHVDAVPDFAVMVTINGLTWEFDLEDVSTIKKDERIRPRNFPQIWMKSFGSRHEIVNRPFKSLNDDDLKKWLDSLHTWGTSKVQPKTTSTTTTPLQRPYESPYWGGKDYDDDKDSYAWWGANRGTSNWNSDIRWSWEIRKYIKTDWMFQNGDLKPEYAEKAFQEKIEEFAEDMLRRHNLYLDFEITELATGVRVVDISDSASGTDYGIRATEDGDLLPGPFSVVGADD